MQSSLEKTPFQRSIAKAAPYLLLLPALAGILIFKIYPIFSAVITSFIRKGAFSLRTYEILFQDKTFWNSLMVTLRMNVVMIPLQIVVSLILALLVNSEVKGVGVFRSIYYLPVTMAISVASVTWALMMNVNNGVFNSVLSIFGIPKQGFFTDAGQALWSIDIEEIRSRIPWEKISMLQLRLIYCNVSRHTPAAKGPETYIGTAES